MEKMLEAKGKDTSAHAPPEGTKRLLCGDCDAHPERTQGCEVFLQSDSFARGSSGEGEWGMSTFAERGATEQGKQRRHALPPR